MKVITMRKEINIGICFFLILISGLLTGCITNDIPYPIVKGEINAFEVSGQLSCEIDKTKREVLVTLADTTDIFNVKVITFEITDSTVCAPIMPNVLDMSTPLYYTLTTYQDYLWKITTVQNIERSTTISGQVGLAVFDEENRTVLVHISSNIPLNNVNIEKLVLGPPNSTLTPDPTTVKDFSYPQLFTVSYHGREEEWHVQMIQTTSVVETFQPREIWAKRAVFSGSFMSGTTDEHGFEYRKNGETEWLKIAQEDIITNGAAMQATVSLEPVTNYKYRAYLGENKGEEISFKTEDAPTIPNLSFDDWSKQDKNWNPWIEGGASFWTSGNKGVTLFKESNTTPTDDAVSGKAAKLETIAVPVVGLASGNIFTGEFETDMLNPLNSTKFGRPFNGKPSKLTAMYKFFPKMIDTARDKPGELGKMDKFHIWIKLENWGTATVKPSNPIEIGYGVFVGEKEISTYTELEIPILYKIYDMKPTHITIVAASSMYGDFYTGGKGTTLYLDELKLVY